MEEKNGTDLLLLVRHSAHRAECFGIDHILKRRVKDGRSDEEILRPQFERFDRLYSFS